MLDSRTLSYTLRHHPEEFGLTLDDYGWCNINKLLKAFDITQDELNYIIKNNTRFIVSEDKTKIKAAHGHSIPIKYENQTIPPKILYHGTSRNFENAIRTEGIKKMERAEVHLSANKKDALKIAKRHGGEPWIIELDTEKMIKDGYIFYRSEDNVWLTSDINPKYFLN